MSRDVGALAESLLDADRPEQALALIGPALIEHPDDVDLACSATRACLMLNRLQEADRHLARALALQPEGERAHRLTALVAVRRRQWDRAAAAARTARRLAPEEWQTQFVVASVGFAARRRDEEARGALRAALLSAGHLPAVHVLAARFARADGSGAASTAHLREALRLDPEHEEAVRLLAEQSGAGSGLALLGGLLRRNAGRPVRAAVEAVIARTLLRASVLVVLGALLVLSAPALPPWPRIALTTGETVVVVGLAARSSARLHRGGTVARRTLVRTVTRHPVLLVWSAFVALELCGFVVVALIRIATGAATAADGLLGLAAGVAFLSAIVCGAAADARAG